MMLQNIRAEYADFETNLNKLCYGEKKEIWESESHFWLWQQKQSIIQV